MTIGFFFGTYLFSLFCEFALTRKYPANSSFLFFSAFMGNRCSRWVARKLVDESTIELIFPFSAKFVEPYIDQNSRPFIVTMGFIRAILPFAFSFQGSRIGRQLTFNTYKYANFRWKPVQSVMKFDREAG